MAFGIRVRWVGVDWPLGPSDLCPSALSIRRSVSSNREAKEFSVLSMLSLISSPQSEDGEGVQGFGYLYFLEFFKLPGRNILLEFFSERGNFTGEG